MSRTQWVIRRLLYALFFNRFEPLQAIMHIAGFLHGVWLVFPRWEFGLHVESISGLPRLYETGLGGLFITTTIVGLVALYTRNESLVKHVDFTEFMAWLFLAIIAFIAAGGASIVWIAYGTLAVIAAFIYLGIAVGGLDGND